MRLRKTDPAFLPHWIRKSKKEKGRATRIGVWFFVEKLVSSTCWRIVSSVNFGEGVVANER